MYPRIRWLAFILWFSGAISAQDFSLDSIQAQFPQEGFEDEIHFWIEIFSQHGENVVVFHDREDVRLIYHIERFSKGIEGDPAEGKRQQKRLKTALNEVQNALKEMAKGGPPRDDMQRAIRQTFRQANISPNPEELRELAQNVRRQRGVATRFAAGLRRSGRYLKYIEEVFRSKGLPEELAMLPHVESSFYYAARSNVGASGIWQLMRGTSRPFLTINRVVDERLDPLAASRAAAGILEENYRTLGNWPMAITAYNHGLNGMRRAREKYGDDLHRIVQEHRSRLFGFASKNFYAEFLAALYVAKNRTYFFPGIEPDPTLEFDDIHLAERHRIQDVATLEGLDLEVLQTLNPHLARSVWRSGVFPAGFDLRVPAGRGETLRAGIQELAAVPYSGPVEVGNDGRLRYRVDQGDTLAMIAHRFGISERSLQSANEIVDRHKIYRGQILILPLDAGTPAALEVGLEESPESYLVQSGDSLARIARRFGTTVQDLQGLNGIQNRHQIYPGQRLQVRGSIRYRVRSGDTLARIARRFNTSVSALKSANGINNANRIYLGQMLQIPAGK